MPFKDCITCIEYLTGSFSPKEVPLLKYNISKINKHNKLCYNLLVTNEKLKQLMHTKFIQGYPLCLIPRIYDKPKIYNTLNTIKDKNQHNELITEFDVLNSHISFLLQKTHLLEVL